VLLLWCCFAGLAFLMLVCWRCLLIMAMWLCGPLCAQSIILAGVLWFHALPMGAELLGFTAVSNALLDVQVMVEWSTSCS
jgi:hypothetical protein